MWVQKKKMYRTVRHFVFIVRGAREFSRSPYLPESLEKFDFCFLQTAQNHFNCKEKKKLQF